MFIGSPHSVYDEDVTRLEVFYGLTHFLSMQTVAFDHLCRLWPVGIGIRREVGFEVIALWSGGVGATQFTSA
ncbi:3807_t:CDS:1, partial [Paraglomus occultum]